MKTDWKGFKPPFRLSVGRFAVEDSEGREVVAAPLQSPLVHACPTSPWMEWAKLAVKAANQDWAAEEAVK